MSANKTFLGRRMMDFTSSPAFRPYSRVTLWVDDNNCYTSGDDTGRTLEADCPWATQEICNTVLAKISGYQYVPYTATDAMLDPAAEIGDGVNVNGRYSVIASIEASFDSMFTANVEAPADEELDHEFPYKSSTTRAFDRKLAQTRAAITVKADEIMLQVEEELNGLSSSIDIKLNSITSTVQGLNGDISTLEQTAASLQSQITSANGDISTLQQTATSLSSQINGVSGDVSSLEQKVDSIKLSVSNGASSSTITLTIDGVEVSSKTIRFTGDVVFASDLKDGETIISGDNILTGTIETARIKLSGKMKVYDDDDNIGGYIGYMAGADLSGSSTDGIAMKNGSNVIIATDAGVRMTSKGAEVICVNNVNLNSDYSVVVDAVNFKSNVSLTVTSDRNLKDEILYDVTDKYLPLFDRLSPASFLYKGRAAGRHLGFIAQDVEEAAAECGIDRADLALLVQDEDGLYGLSYSEFIPILVAKIKSLEKRLEVVNA